MPVNEKIVLDTIKQMKEAGLEDSVILATLKDIEPEKESEETEEKSEEESLVETEEEPNKEDSDLEDEAQEDDLEDTAHAVTHVALHEQGQKLDDLHERISGFEKPAELSQILAELQSIRRDLQELKKQV